MASRAGEKRAARERRLERERALAAAAGQRRRRGMLAGVVVVAVILVVVGIAVSAGGGTHARATDGAIVHAVEGELAGIPEQGTTLGDVHAPVTLTFFGDLQCPICAAFATGQSLDGVTGGLPRFVADEVRAGRAKVVYRSLCTATCNDFGTALFDEQQTAAYAAGTQNRFWYYEGLFYREQGAEGSPYVTSSFLERLARQTPGLDVSAWNAARRRPALLSAVRDDATVAVRRLPILDGGRGTPGLVISGPRGTRFIAEGIVGDDALQAAFAAVASPTG